MLTEETSFDFNNKHALLDTNVLRALLDYPKKSERFAEVFDFLSAHAAQPYIIKRVTDFEFVGYATNKKAYVQLSKWVQQFDGFPPMPEDYENAALLSSLYKCRNPSISPKQISFVDCLYAAQLLRVKERAFIVTADLNDYPSFLFDMPAYFAIEDSTGQTSFVGIKVFNPQKYKRLKASFDKSG